MKLIQLFSLFALLALASACRIAAPENAPPVSAVYQDVTVHGNMPASGNLGARRGESCVFSFAGVYARGDAGVRAAAAAGGITVIKAIDYRFRSVLLIAYEERCTVAYGD